MRPDWKRNGHQHRRNNNKKQQLNGMKRKEMEQ